MCMRNEIDQYLSNRDIIIIKQRFNLEVFDVIILDPNEDEPRSLYIAKNLKTNQEIFIKDIKNNQQNFKEVEIMKRFLDVDHIIQIKETIRDDDNQLIIIEKGYCNLHQYINRCNNNISDENLIQITLNILQGLDIMHQKGKYWLRNLSPENIYVFFKNKNDWSKLEKTKKRINVIFRKQKVYVKIGDLGSTKQYVQKIYGFTRPFYFQPFKCPELYDDQQIYHNKIDVWSAGLTLFELYTKTQYTEFYMKNRKYYRSQERCTYVQEYLFSTIDQICKNKFKKMMKDIAKQCIQYNPDKRQLIRNILNYFHKGKQLQRVIIGVQELLCFRQHQVKVQTNYVQIKILLQIAKIFL